LINQLAKSRESAVAAELAVVLELAELVGKFVAPAAVALAAAVQATAVVVAVEAVALEMVLAVAAANTVEADLALQGRKVTCL
jgi:hypothetical protein